MSAQPQIVLVSNRGPAAFERDEDSGELVAQRGAGGLVTALTGLVHHRDALWIASAMTDADVEASRRYDGSFDCELGDTTYRIRLVESSAEAYDGFYNLVANPMLWFIQHYLWDLSNSPDIRRNEVAAYEEGYKVVNEDLAKAVIEEIAEVEEPVVMVHDYHLYTLPGIIRRERPDAFLHHFIHIPWTQPDAWRVLPRQMRREIYDGVLSNDIVGFHTRAYRHNFLLCCRDLMGYEVDFDKGIVYREDREVWVRSYPLPIDWRKAQQTAESDSVKEFESTLLERRREHLILRVDRAD
ncbi:MAG: trehalose-6-phosphate synthase, partial [Actinomycetota bacterium]|nr:trehalose-6-phosphate synthase [Actinomycetota bacterium]